MSAWLLVSGDFTPYGGMDMANYALASHLARSGRAAADVHLVAHQVSPELAGFPRDRGIIKVHRVPRPFGIHRVGEPLLRATARRVQRQLASEDLCSLANGGNADLGDLNWVHYVHAAFDPPAAGLGNRLRLARNHKRYVVEEQQALSRARLVICNSNRTADDVVKLVGVPRDRTRVIYYGIDSVKFGRVDAAERDAARRMLGLPPARLLALFVGALGDRRKGFDTVFDAWHTLCRRSEWDVDLVVAGSGAELEAWKARSARALPEGRIRFLGFTHDMPAVFAAGDLLIHPARYEPYGLAVHEALCRGLPALVSATAGVAERYPADLGQLLLQDPASAAELVARLSAWRADDGVADRVAEFAARLRARTWEHMAREIVELRGEA
jgi:glycosyltransferase involved in cell wall biosynthesis